MYNGTTINDSPTVAGVASAAITGGEFLAAKFASGKIAVCDTAGELALGIIVPGQDEIEADGDITIQVKDIGRWKAAAAVAAGVELTTDAAGKAAAAATGNFVLAIALEAATAADQIIQVQIVKAGYKA